ncbi:MAG: hypothetical protein WDW36_009146 [Sanguina aurantia]
MALTMSGKQVSACRTMKANQVRSRTVTCAAIRPNWLPGSVIPAHLDGKLAGDYGFDPLNLGTNPETLRWYQQAELVHARTAMIGVAGILIPGVLTKAGVLSVPEWYNAGQISIDNSFAPFDALVAVQIILTGFVETKRLMDFRKPMSQGEPGTFFGMESALAGSGVNGYPGGVFDPMGMSRESPEKLNDLKLKEIKNGRLAMLAFLGFAAQYQATGTGPIDNLLAHVADPWHTTFVENGVSVPGL